MSASKIHFRKPTYNKKKSGIAAIFFNLARAPAAAAGDVATNVSEIPKVIHKFARYYDQNSINAVVQRKAD